MSFERFLNSENWFGYPSFYDEVAKKKYKVLVELGTWKGHSIIHLAKKLQKEEYEFELYGVDLFENSLIHQTEGNHYLSNQIPLLWDIYNANLEKAQVRHLVKDIKESSWKASEKFKDGSVDFLFIDADHKYESVVKDIKSWLPKMKKGGMISGHDFHQPTAGVKKAVEELIPDYKLGTDHIWYKII